jgi:glycosyltransferase involved in cell wall biosynthesis
MGKHNKGNVMNKMKYIIITPAHNEEKYIHYTLEKFKNLKVQLI